MRITGGIYCRRIIQCPKGIIRPSMDRMRESLFAILGDLSGSSFLDLYSGSGIIGLEAASRGAAPVVCVEKDRGKREVLLSNTSLAGSAVTVKITDAEAYVKHCQESFDYIFLDPPFAAAGKVKLLQFIAAKGILKSGGTLLIHHPKEEKLPERIGSFIKSDQRFYGGSWVDFFREERENGKLPSAEEENQGSL